jgi:hypothetical protein
MAGVTTGAQNGDPLPVRRIMRQVGHIEHVVRPAAELRCRPIRVSSAGTAASLPGRTCETQPGSASNQ